MSLNQHESANLANRQGILDERVDAGLDRQRGLPSRWSGGGDTAVRILTIIGGNTLSDGSTLGIKWASSPITSVPSLYDPTVTSVFIDGIGRATLTVDGVSSGTVLVAHFSTNGSPLNLALFAGDVILTSATTISIPLASDSTQSVACYLPYTP